jgi:acetyl-CoA C-acetyltransferase
VTEPRGLGRIEGYTIPHDRRREPSHAIAACRLADGARAWARLESPSDVEAMLAADPIGWGVELGSEEARLVGPGGCD